MNRFTLLLLSSLITIIMSCGATKTISTSKSIPLSTYNFEELDSLISQEARSTVIFLHAPWCQFCKNMEQTTLADQEVIGLLNDNFYFISFDGEQKEDVEFRNYNFKYQPTGRNTGTHELAKSLGTINGALVYPALVVLNSDYEIVFQQGSFLDNDQMISMLEVALN